MATNNLKPPAEEQTPLHDKIARELIELTPEHWRSVRLELVRKPQPPEAVLPGEGVAHSISNPEGHREAVIPGEDLFAHTRELDLLFQKHGANWLSAEYLVTSDDQGVWTWNVSFNYGKKP